MSAAGERGRLLLVVAHDGRREIMAAALTDAGFDVDAVAGVDQALERLEGELPLAVVADITPGEERSFSLLLRVRGRDDGPVAELPVVVSTGRNRDVDRVRAWELGCDGFVPRPHYMTELLEVLEEVVDLSPPDRTRRREEQFDRVRREVAEKRGHQRS